LSLRHPQLGSTELAARPDRVEKERIVEASALPSQAHHLIAVLSEDRGALAPREPHHPKRSLSFGDTQRPDAAHAEPSCPRASQTSDAVLIVAAAGGGRPAKAVVIAGTERLEPGRRGRQSRITSYAAAFGVQVS
jgi:hypothetical protein